MSFVKLRATYYNTNVTEVEHQIDIIDTRADSGQLINFICDREPTVKFSGLPQDLKPGIYPTSITVGMFIESSAQLRHGVTYGPSQFFIDDLFSEPEGTFFIKHYKDSVLDGIYTILPDQCSYEDAVSPYVLTLQAVDGSYKWQDERYISDVGRIKHVALKRESQDSVDEFLPDFVTTDQDGDMLEGTEWIAIEHLALQVGTLLLGEFHYSSSRQTTYARYEQYQVESPGADWVDQGGGLWAKELTYSNESIIDETLRYHLTRDIDDTPYRAISEMIMNGMAVVPTGSEYGAEPMYDVTMQWYEASMIIFTADPFTKIRVSEQTIASGKNWSEVFTEIAKHFYLRIYYSGARFHFEQISERAEVNIIRHKYDFEGTSLGSETVDLDLDYDALGITVLAGGTFKSLAPLKNVIVTQKFADSNLLKNFNWRQITGQNTTGRKYIGRVIKLESDTRLLIQINCSFEGYFDFLTWNGLSEFMQEQSTASKQYIQMRVTARNVNTGDTYSLQPDDVDNAPENESTWEIDPVAAYFEKYAVLFPIVGTHRVQTADFNYRTLTETLPGNLHDSFDINITVYFHTDFINPVAAGFWTNENPDKYNIIAYTHDNSMTTVNGDEEPINADAVRAYEVLNDPKNSLTVEVDAKFGDLGTDGEYMEILDGAGFWHRPSGFWSRNGAGFGIEFLQLLAEEIMSLRTLPRRIYSGAFATLLAGPENRIQRTTHYYLPLQVNINTGVDAISGDFISIARTEPPQGNVVATPFVGEPLPGLTGAPIGPDPQPLYFVTDEVIDPGATLTQVAILNTIGQYVPSGETVTIINLLTGAEEDVVLTQDVDPTDTVMFFSSHFFGNGFPVGSPIILAATDGLPPISPENEYEFSHPSYADDEHYAATYTFPNPEGTSESYIDKRIQIWRNGNLMLYRHSPSGSNEYTINYAASKFTFPIAFTGESIRIRAR